MEAPFLELMKQVVETGHSRFPVHGENKDDILGILLAKDLLRGVVADNGPGNVRELRNVIQRAELLATGNRIEVADLNLPRAAATPRPAPGAGRRRRWAPPAAPP